VLFSGLTEIGGLGGEALETGFLLLSPAGMGKSPQKPGFWSRAPSPPQWSSAFGVRPTVRGRPEKSESGISLTPGIIYGAPGIIYWATNPQPGKPMMQGFQPTGHKGPSSWPLCPANALVAPISLVIFHYTHKDRYCARFISDSLAPRVCGLLNARSALGRSEKSGLLARPSDRAFMGNY